MSMVKPELSSIFNLHTERRQHHTHEQHHSSGHHQMMDWSSHGAGVMNRGVGSQQNEDIPSYNHGVSSQQNEEVPSYVPQGEMYHHSYTMNPEAQFEMCDYYPVEKTELPHHGNCTDDYAYMNSHHQGYLPSGSSLMTSQASVPSFNNPSAPVPGGVLEEVDGILRNFDIPQHLNNHTLDMDPLLCELMQFPQQQQSLFHGGHTGLGPILQDPFAPLHLTSMDGIQDTQVEDLAKSLHVEIMSENSQVGSTMDSCSMNSENTPFIYGSASQAAMHSGYVDGRGSSTGRGWQQPQLHKLQQSGGHLQLIQSSSPQQQASSMSTSIGGGYHNIDPPAFNFQRPPAFGPSQSFSSQHSGVTHVAHHDQQQHPDLGPLHMNGNHGLNNPTVMPATGLQLVHLLLRCAEAVAENNLQFAKVILVRLREHVLPDGNPMQRLAAYFEQALHARLTRENTSPIFKGLTGDKSIPQAEVLEAFSVFYDCIPIGKFGHLTCNQILLDAVEHERVVHVLDLQIWHGMQWPAFLQALALRPGGPPKLRMTALGVVRKDLEETGEKLTECARTLNVPFEFSPLFIELSQFDASMIDQRRGEVLVVNSFVQFHCLLNKGPDLLSKILGGLRKLNPRVVAFAENDGNHNHPLFLTRFVECLRYYSAVFDAFDASLPPDSPARMKMEQIFAAQKIRNIIACEGPARVDGHETMRYWHRRMEGSSFRNIPLSSRAVSQANLLLNLYYSNGYTLNTNEFGYLALGWHGMPLMGVSAWS